MFRGSLHILREKMVKAKPVYRYLSTLCMMAMVAGIIVLSAAAKGPYTQADSAAWHTAKASRMSGATSKVAVENQKTEAVPKPFRKAHDKAHSAFPGREHRDMKSLLRAGVTRFRSPPLPTRSLPFLS